MLGGNFRGLSLEWRAGRTRGTRHNWSHGARDHGRWRKWIGGLGRAAASRLLVSGEDLLQMFQRECAVRRKVKPVSLSRADARKEWH